MAIKLYSAYSGYFNDVTMPSSTLALEPPHPPPPAPEVPAPAAAPAAAPPALGSDVELGAGMVTITMEQYTLMCMLSGAAIALILFHFIKR